MSLAYLLSKKNIDSILLEASSRLGGRVQTVNGRLDTPMELGATWFSDLHHNLIALLEALDIEKYPQFSQGISLFRPGFGSPLKQFQVSPSEPPSYRIKGGSQKLITALSQKLNKESIKLNTKVLSISEVGINLKVETNLKSYQADKVVLCLPPQLISSKINFDNSLNENLSALLPSVQTWMAGAIKFVLEYREPFWREKGYSGMLFSQSDIITELHDHTNAEENRFGFTGFLNGGAISYPQDSRKKLVLQQLETIWGSKASSPLTYQDKVWDDDYILGGNKIISNPHQNNGHPLLQQSYMNDKLIIAGTESSTAYGGYMEGAVISAQRSFYQLTESKVSRFDS